MVSSGIHSFTNKSAGQAEFGPGKDTFNRKRVFWAPETKQGRLLLHFFHLHSAFFLILPLFPRPVVDEMKGPRLILWDRVRDYIFPHHISCPCLAPHLRHFVILPSPIL